VGDAFQIDRFIDRYRYLSPGVLELALVHSDEYAYIPLELALVRSVEHAGFDPAKFCRARDHTTP
jgi:hypothetical protein